MKTKFWKVFTAFAAGVALMPLAACDNEDYTSSPNRPDYDINYVYLYEPVQAYSSIEFKATGDFLENLDNPLALTPVRCTKPAPADIHVQVVIDPTLVDSYNEANKTDYGFLTGVELVSSEFTIPKGEYLSTEEIAMNVVDREALKQNQKDLILPIKIETLSGDGKISEHNEVYIHFIYEANFITVSPYYQELLGQDPSTWSASMATLTLSDALSSSWAADGDLTFTVEPSSDYVAAFNEKYGKGYEYQFLEGVTVKSAKIAQGASKGDIVLSASVPSGMASGTRYVVPLRIKSVSGIGAELTSDEEICYVAVYVPPFTLMSGTPEGSRISYDSSMNWTLSVNGSKVAQEATEDSSESLWSELFLCNGYVAPWAEGDVCEIDFGQTYNLSGLGMSFYAWYYALVDFKSFEYSADGSTWNSAVIDFTWSAYSSTGTIKFSFPVEARYLRFTIGEPNYNYTNYEDIWNTGIYFYAK